MYMKQYLLIILDRESEALDVIAQQLIETKNPMTRGDLKKAVNEFIIDNSLDSEYIDQTFAVNSLRDAGAWDLSESYVMKCIAL